LEPKILLDGIGVFLRWDNKGVKVIGSLDLSLNSLLELVNPSERARTLSRSGLGALGV